VKAGGIFGGIEGGYTLGVNSGFNSSVKGKSIIADSIRLISRCNNKIRKTAIIKNTLIKLKNVHI
jgi:hypothetical protein